MRTLQGQAHMPTVPCPCRLCGLRQVLTLNWGSGTRQQEKSWDDRPQGASATYRGLGHSSSEERCTFTGAHRSGAPGKF